MFRIHLPLKSALAAFLAIAGLAGQAQDWPQLQRDPQRSGRTTVSVQPGGEARWVWVDESHITHGFVSQRGASIKYPKLRSVILAGDVQPIVAEDRIYFGTCSGEFYALDGDDASTVWKRQLGGPILHTAACGDGVVVVASMDGKLHAFDAADGRPRWTYATGAGISVAILLLDGAVYAGSRDGTFYGVDLKSGKLKWSYRTITDSPEHPHSGAPIMQSAASDGTRVFFGAENMFFYALEAKTGRELWRKKLGGQSFLYSWPVVHGDLVMTFVMVPDGLSEYKMEKELDGLPGRAKGESRAEYAGRIWPEERSTIRSWLAANPGYRNFHVMKTADGSPAFEEEVPMGRVGGIGYPGRSPVIDSANRVLMYWRTKSSVLLTGGSFGTKYTPDISAMDPSTGDRIWFEASSGMNVELDNNFTLTVGGDWLYLNNHMRGAHCINLKTGNLIRATSILADWDGANFRNWGNRLIWISNDDEPKRLPPPSVHRAPQGDCGVVLATIRGRPIMLVQESGHYQIDFGCLAAVGGER